jgi:glycosyltransferase involved in cell wall biosynthesis
VADKASRVRVLIVHPRDLAAPTIGGIQTFLHDFVKYAPPEFEITFAGVTRDTAKYPVGRRRRLEVDGREVWLLPLGPAGALSRNPLSLLRMAFAQARLRREMLTRGTILQLHRPFKPFIFAGHRGPRVQFIHVDIRDWPGPAAWNRLRGLYRQFSDRALNAMAHVFVVNEPGVAILRAEYPQMAERIEFLPVWYDDAVFRPALRGEHDALRGALWARMGLGDGAARDPLILFAARLDEIKDPALAIDGYAEFVRTSETPARLLIAGEGDLRPKLEQQVAALNLSGRVRFIGDRPRDELAILMRAVDVLLLTSRSEGGGPRVVLEALASGLPVVATEVGEVRRTVLHCSNGWLIASPSTPAAVAEGVRWALAEPREKVVEAARAASRPYTARVVLQHVYDTYRQLAADSR